MLKKGLAENKVQYNTTDVSLLFVALKKSFPCARIISQQIT